MRGGREAGQQHELGRAGLAGLAIGDVESVDGQAAVSTWRGRHGGGDGLGRRVRAGGANRREAGGGRSPRRAAAAKVQLAKVMAMILRVECR